MDVASRSKWYLKNLFHCKQNGWIMITHEYMRDHWEQLQSEISQSLFDSWEISPFLSEDIEDVEQYYLPDSLFEQIEKQCGSRTEMLYQLSSSVNEPLLLAIQQIIDQVRQKHPHEKINGMFHCLEAWKTFYALGQENHFPIIPYSFSAFRKPHGYRQTLYHCNLHTTLNSTKEAKERYERFLSEGENDFPIFSNRELVAIFGKERTLPLIPLMNAEPKYEMGICTECFSVIPQFFVHDKTTDDDVRYECEKLYDKSQITVRNHSLQVDYMQLDRSMVHNDPAAWILSCRRLSAARSQIGLKFLLWNRTAIVKPDTLGYSFLCEKDYSSVKKVNIQALNFYLFAYLVPNDLMFSGDYWAWRLTNPSEKEIYHYHYNFYKSHLHLPDNILTNKDENARFASILKCRGCDSELISILLENCCKDFDYDTALSRIDVNGKSHWRMNEMKNGIRNFHISIYEKSNKLIFYPLDDVAGFVRIRNITVNGKKMEGQTMLDYIYYPKGTGFCVHFRECSESVTVDIEWQYVKSARDFKTCEGVMDSSKIS